MAVSCSTDFITSYYSNVLLLKVIDSVVQVGNCGDMCLSADTFGVVYISASTIITCATCRYGKTSCQHVRKLFQILSDSEDLPQVLLPYAHVHNLISKNSFTPKKNYPILKCISTQKTPFHLPLNLSAILSKPTSERFSFTDGIALLHPDNSVVCKYCGLSNWMEDSDLFINAKIVTINSIIPAKGN